MSRPGKLGSVAIAAAVVAVIGIVAGRVHHPAGPELGGPARVATTTATVREPVARVVQGDQVPELRGRPVQRDVDQDAPTVRAYRSSHRLLEQLPQTYRGVTFDSAGRTLDGRVRLTANPNGLSAGDARQIYRRLLRRARDTGSAYALTVLAPTGAGP